MSRGAVRQRQRDENPCRVYWASHGCKKQKGHTGIHVCDCGDRLEDWMPTYGEDAVADDLRVVHGEPPIGWDADKYPSGPKKAASA